MLTEHLYQQLIGRDVRGKYVFALLARDEFSADASLEFAYQPMPAEDRDMRIIHEALAKALGAGALSEEARSNPFFVELEFFDHLREEKFKPTPTSTGEPPLLRQIMDDPENWSYELVSRMTDRLMLLEQNAQQIIADRDPQLDYSDQGMTALVGSGSYILRTATHKHRAFEFAPSTAPKEWWWRNLIPYEIGFEAGQGDLTATWQPTYAATPVDVLSLRGSIGFAGNLIDSANDSDNFLSLGFGYTRLSRFAFATSWGVAPVYYHYLKDPQTGDRNTWGADVHLGLMKNRLRLGFGVRDFDNASDTAVLSIGFTDIPGLIYWTTR
jgi:hypothetical protein